MRMKNNRVKEYFRSRTASDIVVITLMALLLSFYMGSMIYFAVIGRVRDSLLTILYSMVVPVYFLIEYKLHVKIPVTDAFVVVLFVAFCELGASYNLYTIIPGLDNILHSVWGLVFTLLGITIIKSLLGEPQTKKAFITYIIFGFAFCCFTAVLWEIFEFSTDQFLPNMDQQEDTIITGFQSFLLYPGYDHLHSVTIDGIAYTVLYDAQGNILYTIEGGYLDIGIYDTMWDIICCTAVSFIVCVAFIIERCANRKFLNNLLIPRLVPVKEPAGECAAAVPEDDEEELVTVGD